MKNLYSTKRLIVRKERRKSWELSRMSIFALQKKPRDGKEENGRPIGKTPNINIRHSHTLFPPPISLPRTIYSSLFFSFESTLSFPISWYDLQGFERLRKVRTTRIPLRYVCANTHATMKNNIFTVRRN